tara:strand:+ start:1029 stop:1613 length:585 start_codon:yes stop_codon:yes gene_type:complete
MSYKVLVLIIIFNLVSSITVSAFDKKMVLDSIQESWNDTATMSGNFIQYNSDDTLSYGNFYFSKPFKSKFIYENNNETIITTEALIVLLDKEGFRVESYPLLNSPIKNLLADKINFENLNSNIRINEEKNFYYIYMANLDDKNTAIFSFEKDSLDLKKWEIIDEFGQSTVLEFTKVKKNIFISPETYKVRYKNN